MRLSGTNAWFASIILFPRGKLTAGGPVAGTQNIVSTMLYKTRCKSIVEELSAVEKRNKGSSAIHANREHVSPSLDPLRSSIYTAHRFENTKAAETRDRLAKNLIDLYIGQAEILSDRKRAEGEHGEVAVRVCRPKGCLDVPAHHICVATGSR